MARMTNREKYVEQLLKVCKDVTGYLYTEISEVHHDRGRSSGKVKETLVNLIEEDFEPKISYGEDKTV